MIGPKEKKERYLNTRLGLKGERCSSPKCAMVRKPYPPGVHGQKRSRKNSSEFGLQLKEKQKFKLSYGLDDRNLKRLFVKATKSKGSSAEKLIELLEKRLDNVVFRSGLSLSRNSARQLVLHGHINVNSKLVRSPGFEVKFGDVVKIKSGSEMKSHIGKTKDQLKNYEPPVWIQLDKEKLESKIIDVPKDTDMPFEISLLVESFSK